jgi:peptidoglycan/LPS O-acetylase OafA/YrhL
MPLPLKPTEVTTQIRPIAGNAFHESTNLDILRSIAVTVIVGCHFVSYAYHTGEHLSPAWLIGQVGLWMFFVHTCVVLMWSVERSVTRGPHYLAAYFTRRILRIYPLSMFFVLFAYVFDARWIPTTFWRTLTLTQNLSLHHVSLAPGSVYTMWTLPLQVEMSLALPVFLFFRKRPVVLLWLLWAFSIPLVYLRPHLGDAFAIFEFLPSFLGGVIGWRLTRERNRQWFPAWMWPVSIVAVSSVWILINDKTLGVCEAAFGACLGFLLPHFPEIKSRTIATVSRIIARYSFSIYLVHFPIILYFMEEHAPSNPRFRYLPPAPVFVHFSRSIHLVIVLTLTAFVSYLTYNFIEKPGIDLGHKIAKSIVAAHVRRQKLAAELAS